MTQTTVPQSDQAIVRRFLDSWGPLVRLIAKAMHEFPKDSEERTATCDGLVRIYQFTRRPADDRSDDGWVLWPPTALADLAMMTWVLGDDIETVLRTWYGHNPACARLAAQLQVAKKTLADALRDIDTWRAERKKATNHSLG